MCAARMVANLFKLYRAEYIAPRAPRIVPVSDAKYLVIDGDGAFGSESLATRASGLRALSGALRDVLLTRHKDFTLPKLECRWRTAAQNAALSEDGLPRANWVVLMRVPGFVQPDDLQVALSTIETNAHPQTDQVKHAQLESVTGGQCLQSLHRGAYNSLSHSFAAMLKVAQLQSLSVDNVRHLIFLSDPKHVPPEHLRTILRIPLLPPAQSEVVTVEAVAQPADPLEEISDQVDPSLQLAI